MIKQSRASDPKIIEAEENLLIDFQLLIQDLMNKKNVTQSELAEKARISKARLSQILSSEANPTLKTFARLLFALDEKLLLETNDRVSHAKNIARGRWIQLEDLSIERGAPSKSSRRQESQLVDALVTAAKASNDNYVEIPTIDANLLFPEAA